jgi:membrane-associated PAP2 superfamily phosphatase
LVVINILSLGGIRPAPVRRAFLTIAPVALAPPGWRALAYSAAIAFGVIISASRIIMGGHFQSDTIFSGVFTFLIIGLMYALIYRWPRTRLDDQAVDTVFTRF